MPRASSTSAEPTLPLALRFPCLATEAPQAAATKATAVEILKLLAPSPPVPQVSTRCSAGRDGGITQAWRSTWAMPASSSPLTPLALRATSRPPVNTGSIWASSHPSIRPTAWSALRSCRSNSWFNRAGQLLEAVMAIDGIQELIAHKRAEKNPGAKHTGPGDGDISTITRGRRIWPWLETDYKSHRGLDEWFGLVMWISCLPGRRCQSLNPRLRWLTRCQSGRGGSHRPKSAACAGAVGRG